MTLHAGPTSQTFISQRLRLHYLDWGNRGKPPLVLVHGGRDHARSWDWVAEQLRDDWSRSITEATVTATGSAMAIIRLTTWSTTLPS